MNEIALNLGADRSLVGILTPAVGPRRPLGVLLLNAGVVHRIGPHRTSVKLARRLAEQGHTVMRFDISGVGDSRPPKDGTPFRKQAVSDIGTAMDHMQREHGLESFALFGICAGAQNGYAAALEDPRVKALFFFDGYTYPTIMSRFKVLAARVRSASLSRAIRRLPARLSGLLARIGQTREGANEERGLDDANWAPPKQQFAAGLQRLVDRGVHITMIFSGGFYPWYVYQGQFRDGFRGHAFVDRITCRHVPEIDHLVTQLQAQRQLSQLVSEWALGVPVAA